MRKLTAGIAALALAISGNAAFAGSSSIAVTPGSGATYQVGTLGGGNFFGLGAICDGSACANIAAVKAASTAAAATDPSLVVNISPNSPMVGTAGSAGASVFTVQGIASMTPLLATVSQATAANLNATVVANSGAYAAGSLASGAGVDGWNLTEGTKADAAWASGSGSIVAILKAIANGVTGSIPGGSATIGKVDILGNSGATLDGATSSAAPTQALLGAGDAQSAEPTKATTGNLFPNMLDLVGKQVTSPYSNRENQARGYVALSGTSAGTILAASGSASLKEYVTDLTCTRNDAGTTAVSVTLNDTASTVIDLPNNGGGGGYSHTYNVPLVFAANTAATATASSSITTIHCSSTGFYGY